MAVERKSDVRILESGLNRFYSFKERTKAHEQREDALVKAFFEWSEIPPPTNSGNGIEREHAA